MAGNTCMACQTHENGKHVGISSGRLPLVDHPYVAFELDQAVHPTEKAFRPSHRASFRGSILHDASYIATIEVKGPELILIPILELISDVQGPSPGAAR